jgi:hypothetical protein
MFVKGPAVPAETARPLGECQAAQTGLVLSHFVDVKGADRLRRRRTHHPGRGRRLPCHGPFGSYRRRRARQALVPVGDAIGKSEAAGILYD